MDLSAITGLFSGSGSESTAETITSFAAVLTQIINLLKQFLISLGFIEEEEPLTEAASGEASTDGE